VKATALESLLHGLMSVAMLAAMSTVSVTVLAQTADRPTLKVGDRWTYEVRAGQSRVKSVDRLREITAVTPERIEGTENGSAFVMTTDLNNVESALRKDSDQRLLSFPLQVGKKWSFSDEYTDYSRDGIVGKMDVDAEVVGYEKVRVPAGEFDAFKLQADGKRIEGGNTTGISWTYWYAPAARAVVKWETRVVSAIGTVYYSFSELAEYRLQP
jgi:hypothetical protein